MTGETRRKRVLVLDEEPLVRDFLEEYFTRKGWEVQVAARAEEVGADLGETCFHVVFTDYRPGMRECMASLREAAVHHPAPPVVVLSTNPTVEVAVEAMRLGASDLLTKPFEGEQIERVLSRVLGPPETKDSGSTGRAGGVEGVLIGGSQQMQEVRHLIRIAATTGATVLVTGETGTGKELVARAIHDLSPRAGKPFIRFNCAALTETLYESELFGHERGAFTGAIRERKGRFELAHGGTLLMDEISEISWSAQAKLLRVLQEKEFERVGGCSTVRVDARLIATTNKELAREIREERFRADLYYRLSVFPISVPPLRERREDIPLLTDHFLSGFLDPARRGRLHLSRAARDLLMEHTWPGNVRELLNVLERAALMANGPTIEPDHLTALSGVTVREATSVDLSDLPTIGTNLQDAEANLILRALEESGGIRTEAARKLGITPRTLRNKLHRLGKMEFMKQGAESGKTFPPDGGKESRLDPVSAGPGTAGSTQIS